jgi:hypothetical protein
LAGEQVGDRERRHVVVLGHDEDARTDGRLAGQDVADVDHGRAVRTGDLRHLGVAPVATATTSALWPATSSIPAR